jgi:hypothetical protein
MEPCSATRYFHLIVVSVQGAMRGTATVKTNSAPHASPVDSLTLYEQLADNMHAAGRGFLRGGPRYNNREFYTIWRFP